jgi:hypothetical protein
VPSIKGQIAQSDSARSSVVSRIKLSWGSSIDIPVRFEFAGTGKRAFGFPGWQSVSLNRHKDSFGVRECVKIFELDGHFVRLRNVNKKG